jgi:hypothetical protein
LVSNLIVSRDCLPNLFFILQIARAMGKVRIERRNTFLEVFANCFFNFSNYNSHFFLVKCMFWNNFLCFS